MYCMLCVGIRTWGSYIIACVYGHMAIQSVPCSDIDDLRMYSHALIGRLSMGTGRYYLQ